MVVLEPVSLFLQKCHASVITIPLRSPLRVSHARLLVFCCCYCSFCVMKRTTILLLPFAFSCSSACITLGARIDRSTYTTVTVRFFFVCVCVLVSFFLGGIYLFKYGSPLSTTFKKRGKKEGNNDKAISFFCRPSRSLNSTCVSVYACALACCILLNLRSGNGGFSFFVVVVFLSYLSYTFALSTKPSKGQKKKSSIVC